MWHGAPVLCGCRNSDTLGDTIHAAAASATVSGTARRQVCARWAASPGFGVRYMPLTCWNCLLACQMAAVIGAG